VLNWFLARAERDAAKLAAHRQSERQKQLIARSRELFDVAEELTPDPARQQAAVTLHLDGLRFSLAALADVPETFSPASMVASLPTGAPEVVRQAAQLLVAARPALAPVQDLHRQLLEQLEWPLRAEAHAQRLPFLRVGRLLIAVTLAWALGPDALRWLTSPRNLAWRAPWTTSSSAFTCRPSQHDCGGTRTDILFHTNNEANPWFQYDLGEREALSGLTVVNRQDELQARAVPLVVEVSDDGASWREVARQPTVFSTWEPRFAPVEARFVRLRVDGTSALHLERVEVHP
jgi:hypothetical protein